MANLWDELGGACPMGKRLRRWLKELRTTVAGCVVAIAELIDDHATFKTAVDESKTLLDELHDDHATLRTAVDEIITWAEALAAKLNADTGVNDTDYDTDIAASAPDALTASKPSAGPEDLTTGYPTDPPAELESYT